ncbi:hypothetical protein GQ53DRAFT_667154 [Thozetella sp. PMI_491]|nr:hypothetical protein GQ53DRAFT_667154 [Thozetella sp. PMI_491]
MRQQGSNFHQTSPNDDASSAFVKASPDCRVYGETLALDEFRLIYLWAAEDTAQPLHVSIKVYRYENCPEYETVSYTWGGENQASRLCRPIYVDDYYDILMQTKNCWEMLRWLRPEHGVRVLWVDAICINQQNLAERSHQVASMGRIYTECSQVTLWLGSDLVQRKPGFYPRRQRLAKLREARVHQRRGTTSNETMDIYKLLDRRYFSRLWIIQELVLAPRVVIPLMDWVFWADGSDLSLPGHVDWAETRAPWFSHLAQTTIPTEDLFELVSYASRSEAADSRDRLFGVLGLRTEGSEEAI